MNLKLNPLIFAFIISILTTPIYGYLSIMESGEPVQAGDYHIGFAPQFVTDIDGASNAVFNLRTQINSGQDFSLQLGSGHTRIWSTIASRWVPIPDVQSQPALGIRYDITLAQQTNQSTGVFRLAPFISKRFRTEAGHLEPYAYLPMGVAINNDQTQNLSSLTIGTQLQVEDLRPIYFYVESGINLKGTHSYFLVGIFSIFERK